MCVCMWFAHETHDASVQLTVHFSGAVELEKLTLKRDALKKLRLPIEIKAGRSVNTLTSLLPYYTLGSQATLANFVCKFLWCTSRVSHG